MLDLNITKIDADITSQNIIDIIRGTSDTNMFSGFSPSCLVWTKYKYRNSPYITIGTVSIMAWLSGRVGEVNVYRVYAIKVDDATMEINKSRRDVVY